MERNRFLLVPISQRPPPGGGIDPPVLLSYGQRVVIGRRSNPEMLDSLHISRNQVAFDLCLDSAGRTLICMTTVRAPLPAPAPPLFAPRPRSRP